MYSIFKGEVDSENHQIFFQGNSKERNQIQIQNRCGPLFYLHPDHVRIATLLIITNVFLSQYQELHDIVVSWVKNWSSREKKEVHEVKYVSDVLFPEVWSCKYV